MSRIAPEFGSIDILTTPPPANPSSHATMAAAVQPQPQGATAQYLPAAGSSKTQLSDYGLLIYDRYTNIFEPVPPTSLPEDCVRIGPDDVVFLIEAPLNAVELYEAILKPRGGSLTVHRARTVPRLVRAGAAGRGALVEEYLNGQGKLAVEEEREVSFVVLPRDAVWQLQMYHHFIWPVQLQYMSLPVRVSGNKTVCSPYAVVCYNGHRVYHKKLKGLLKDMHLSNDLLSRSLLRPRTVPLPETLKDYLEGVPGKDAATPYYMPEEENTGASRPNMLRRVTSNIPTVRRAVSRVSLRRIRSAQSVGGVQ